MEGKSSKWDNCVSGVGRTLKRECKKNKFAKGKKRRGTDDF